MRLESDESGKTGLRGDKRKTKHHGSNWEE